MQFARFKRPVQQAPARLDPVIDTKLRWAGTDLGPSVVLGEGSKHALPMSL